MKIEKYLKESTTYDEIVDFVEDHMAAFEAATNDIASNDVNLRKVFDRLDASWEVFKRDLKAMEKALKKVGY